jgi:aspartyl-tRNA(Asn)/glutamyl-tRNA(Gln) amidotransferase subunit B
MRYLGVSNTDMEHGDFRVDANVSLREEKGPFHSKTEVKNLNSFRAVERALQYEIRRQSALWSQGTPPVQSTRGWDDEKEETVEQRVKEEEADYRYFPEPDVPPLRIEPSLVEKLRQALPELPHEKEERFRRQFQLPTDQAHLLVEDRTLAAFAENVFSEIAAWNADRTDVEARDTPRIVKLATNYLLGDFRTVLSEENVPVAETKISPEDFAEIIVMLHRAEVNRNAIPHVLREMQRTGGDASTIVAEKGLAQVSDDDKLRRLVQNVIVANPAEVDKVRGGKTEVLQFLVGRVMAETKGRANPHKVQELLRQELGLSAPGRY